MCERCGTQLRRTLYEVRDRERRAARCLLCAAMHPATVVRSLIICALVGTILTAINQGNVILQGDASFALAWKIPLTYVVPYTVATAGAVLNARRSASKRVR